jgi:hypothetical protein
MGSSAATLRAPPAQVESADSLRSDLPAACSSDQIRRLSLSSRLGVPKKRADPPGLSAPKRYHPRPPPRRIYPYVCAGDLNSPTPAQLPQCVNPPPSLPPSRPRAHPLRCCRHRLPAAAIAATAPCLLLPLTPTARVASSGACCLLPEFSRRISCQQTVCSPPQPPIFCPLSPLHKKEVHSPLACDMRACAQSS